jgi:hypothetical protein
MIDTFSDKEDPAQAANDIKSIYNKLHVKYPNKHIVLETGWSTVDSSKYDQMHFIDEINKLNLDVFFFEYADEDWKINPKEAGYGILTSDRQEKDDGKAIETIVEKAVGQYIESVQKDPTTQAATGVSLAGVGFMMLKFLGFLKFGSGMGPYFEPLTQG